MRKNNIRFTLRLLGIVVLIALAAGMIGYSVHSVRYSVDGVPTNELTITNLSLTHCIERDSDGNFTNPYAEETKLPVQSAPLVVASASLDQLNLAWTSGQNTDQQLTAKKSKAKKPAKKPSKKPKKKPKACPT